MSAELTSGEREELARRIDCPVSWCEGRWLQHGGDGAPPHEWFHEEREVALGHDAYLSRSQVGAAPVVWAFSMRNQHIVDTTEPLELAHALGELAFRIAEITRHG